MSSASLKILSTSDTSESALFDIDIGISSSHLQIVLKQHNTFLDSAYNKKGSIQPLWSATHQEKNQTKYSLCQLLMHTHLDFNEVNLKQFQPIGK